MSEPQRGTPTSRAGAGGDDDRVAALRREQRARWLRGERVPVEAYLGGEGPTTAVAPDSALVLIHGEYLLRQEMGEAPALEEYLGRFPEYAERLRMVDSVHRLLADEAGSDRERAPAAACPPGYTILEEIGRGGMGIIYRARQHALGRIVALKVLRDDVTSDPAALGRLRVEADALARLSHPQIVAVYDFLVQDGRAYLAVEHVAGGSLDRRLDGAPWGPAGAAVLVEALARAIHEAHARGIVHRDLKPANILLTDEGAAKISDFGLARLLDSDRAATRTGQILGTPSYMAPEQADELGGPVGPSADVYALGAILYELLTGRPPFRAASVLETLVQVREHEPVTPRRLQPGLSRDLETICLKCLQKRPQQRYATAGDLADDLRRYLDNRPIAARPLGPGRRFARWCRRRPALAAASGLAAAATGLALGLAVLFALAQDRARREIQSQWVRSETLAASLALDRGLAHCNSGETALGMLWLVRALEMIPPGATDLDRAIRFNLAAWRPEVVPLVGRFPHRAGARHVAFSPDGRLFVSAGRDGDVQVRDARTLRLVVPPLHHESWVNHPAFSRDGRTLFASTKDHAAHAWDLATGRPARPPTRLPDDAWAIAWKGDGTAMVAATDAGRARLLDARTAEPLGPALPHPATIMRAAMLADDATLMTASGTAVRFWDPIRGVEVRPRLEHASPLNYAAISADGRSAATACEGQVIIWDAGRGRALGEPLSFTVHVISLAFDLRGRWLAIGGDDGRVHLWDLVNRRPLAGTLEHTSTVGGLAFRPDGRALLTGSQDGHARLWDLAGLGHPAAPFLAEVDPSRLELAPDGRWLLASDTRNEAALWAIGESAGPARDARAGPRLRLEAPADDPPAAHGLYTVAFRRDGRIVATAGTDPVVRPAVRAGTGSVVRFWQTDTGRSTGKPLRFPRLVRGLAFLPDQALVIAGDDHTARVWDPAAPGWRGAAMSHDAEVTSVAVSPDGRLIATGSSDRTARLWDARTGRPVGRPLVHQGNLTSVAFRPDGRALLTASIDRVARQWDLATNEPTGIPLRHRSPVAQAAYSPDGQLIATGGPDGFAQLWDAATGKPVGPSLRHEFFAGGVAFHPGGRLLLTNGWDFTVRAWDIPSPAVGDLGQLALRCQVLTGMELSPDGSGRELEDDAWQERRERNGGIGGPAPLP